MYALDVEMVHGNLTGENQLLAGRVVLVRSDPRKDCVKVLDTYVKYDEGVVQNYMTKWSRLEPWMLESGVTRDVVVDFLLRAITGKTLVTFSGRGDLMSLGISDGVLSLFVGKHVELQEYFKRWDGSPYGLGPLVNYYGYKRQGRPVIINHNCVEDATYTLKLYKDHYDEHGEFEPTEYIPSKREYNRVYGII